MDALEPQPPTPLSPFKWLPTLWKMSRRRLRPQVRLLGLSLLLGIIAGIGAVLFYIACVGVFHFTMGSLAEYYPREPKGESRYALFEKPLPTDYQPNIWWLLLLPTLGGLVSGVIVYTLAPEAEGHGTDSVIAAYHFRQGIIRPLVPLVKIVASAVTIGTGGSGGREGPIAQVGAGFGSLLGRLANLRPADRRVLMAAGMGAGIAAIFRAPLAGALFASEVLYRSPDFESEVILPAGLASVTAYCTFGSVFGWSTLFDLPRQLQDRLAFHEPRHLLAYFVLSIAMVILAMMYTRTFYGISYLFKRLPILPHFKPALGGLLTGLVGVGLYLSFSKNLDALSVMSFGYGVLQNAMSIGPKNCTWNLAALLLAVAIGKIVTTSFSIGSGGSGGVFGPSMVIGGCGGGALGIALVKLFGAASTPAPIGFVLVGMAAFFSAAAKTPFSTLVMVSELTGNYALLLPSLWSCVIAYLFADSQSIYSNQVENQSQSPAHQGNLARALFSGLFVNQCMVEGDSSCVVKPGDALSDVLKRLENSTTHVLAVVDDDRRLAGIIGVEEIQVVEQMKSLEPLVKAIDLMRGLPDLPHPSDSINHALELFAEAGLPSLPVVEPGPTSRFAGMLRQSDLQGLYLHRLQEMFGKEEG